MEEDRHEPSGSSPRDNRGGVGGGGSERNHLASSGGSLSSSLAEDDLFEPVSLRDLDFVAAPTPRSDPALVFTRPSGSDDFNRSSAPLSPPADASVSPPVEMAGDLPRSPSDQGSTGNFYSYLSPVASPPKPRPKPATSDVPPDIVHLVDSAIMGRAEGLEKLKSVVSEGSGDDVIGVSRSVVDSLLTTMGGVEGLDEVDGSRDAVWNPPTVMLSSRAAVVATEIIPWLPCEWDSLTYMSPRTRMAKGLLLILRACTRNRTMCSAAGLLRALLQSAEKINSVDHNSWDGKWLFQCIQVLAEHSLSTLDLHRWLDLIKKSVSTDLAAPLLLALENAMGSREAMGPAYTFEFDGESSGLLGPGDSRWPFYNGYGFATWIYIESFSDTLNTATAAAAIAAAAAAKSGKSSAMSAAAAASVLAGEGTAHMPRLFSFLSSDNQGVEAYFHGQFLVVECGSGKGRKASLHFTHAFKPQCWYFVGLEHSCKQSLLGKAESELRLYVDGNLYESRPFEFPRISKPLAFCCIGTNPPPTMAGLQRRRRQCPLFAEMGPVYIFKEPIGPEKMCRLASRGGDALPCFGNAAGLLCMGMNDHVRSMAKECFALDADISGSLHLLYHPKLLNGRYCQDASPSGSAGIHRRPAEVLGQVYVASRLHPAEALWALAYGGPMALLPMTVSNVEKESQEPILGDFALSLATTSLSAHIFRIISIAIQLPGNNEELCRTRAPEVLSRILHHLLQSLSKMALEKQHVSSAEELVAAIVSLCHCQRYDQKLKVHLFRTLLLDLKLWSRCNYGLQKKLLSSLSDMVFTEASVMREANALQMLLDGCRRCYWVVREKDSVDTFSPNGTSRPIGEVNALIDELLVVIELLVGAASPSLAGDDVRSLIGFMIDCPQPNQVARVLHLFYRLVVQPNTSRASTFAQAFISCGGIETLLVLLQQEVNIGNCYIFSSLDESDKAAIVLQKDSVLETSLDARSELSGEKEPNANNTSSKSFDTGQGSYEVLMAANVERMALAPENQLLKNLGGISLSISAESARNNVYNVDDSDGVIVGIISLLGALITNGHLKIVPNNLITQSSNILGIAGPEGGTMFDDKVSLIPFALQKAFQAASCRLMTKNVYTTLLGAAINVSTADDGLNLYDYGHHFEHMQLLLILLRSLPYASRAFQVRAIQDLLFLACSNSENRSSLTSMPEWPEWLLDVLISNFEMGSDKDSDGVSIAEIEDLIHNFLIIMLEHSMRRKDGWKDVESTIHCAEWLSIVGGSSTGEQRVRREESLPVFKRRLLGGLLDFSARELQVQTQIIAAAAAGVAAEGLSPSTAKLQAENAAHLSVALAENAIVILMLVEDHLRLQGQLFVSSRATDSNASPASLTLSTVNRSNSLGIVINEPMDSISKRSSLSSDAGGLPLDVLASMADANGQISAVVMERLTAAAAAEPYESVRCAFVSYGSCVVDLLEGWKYRSRLWYGVGLPSKASIFGGGGSGWESWNTALEKGTNETWIELPLVKKSIAMLQALLLDESGIGGGLGIGGGSGTGMGGMTALYQLLDSDQPFLCMLRMVLAAMREEDNGEDDVLMRNINDMNNTSEGSNYQSGNLMPFESGNLSTARKPRSALLWSVLSPILNMPISESKRQRVLVSSCILFSEVWHAIGRDRKPLRKQYVEAIVPPFVAILRRWRPLLAGIHEFTSSDGQNPLIVDDRALAADLLPLEAAISMISPGWAAAFASPPAAMGLAMVAAGASGGEVVPPVKNVPLKRDTSLFERKTIRLQTFSSFQKPPDPTNKSVPAPKDKAAAKAAALAAARDLERNAKIGSGRGLCAVAMATSAQRRSASDAERAKRWNVSEAMGAAWNECLQSVDSKTVSGRDFSALSYKYVAILIGSFALARNIRRGEMDRRLQVDILDKHQLSIGNRAWRKLLHRLVEMGRFYGPFGDILYNSDHVFWKLDSTESSSRMRRFLKRNYKGSDHLGAAADYEDRLHHRQSEESDVYKESDQDASVKESFPSTASVLIAEAISLEERTEEDEQTDNAISETNSNSQQKQSLVADKGSTDRRNSGASNDHSLVQSTFVDSPGYVPSDSDERIITELPSLMVRPLKVLRGNFQVTTKRINFIIDERASENSFEDAAISPNQSDEQEKDRSWLLSSIHQMFSRRYLLRRSALELFMVDRSNFFFDFINIESRKSAYRAIVQARPPHLNNIYLATQKPEQILKRTQLMERWARWEISNFEYLMELNTLAGRSYNDITQYPVFPWILADYSSKKLDLQDPTTYRDLSKPIGALNPERLRKFQERYSSFEDPVIPKFHYGSHYSSAGTVMYYLFRVEPFTTLSIQLQGGKFDHADRMFSDIGSTWDGVLEDMSDVKELVPEMFYLPEVLININSIDFGTTQLGGKLDAVKLPPWADNPVDFIHKHRMALESEHVSSHLHNWIDLIFGYKQRGKEAIEANNVFFYITYEGTVNVDKIEDPVQRRATQDQIAYFGQTPSQLLTIPHLRKRPLADVLHLQTIYRNPAGIKPYTVPNPDRCNLPAGAIFATHDSIVVVDMNAPAAHVALHKWQPNTPDGQGTPFLFQHSKFAANLTSGGSLMRMFKGQGGYSSDDWQYPQALAFPASGIRSSEIVAVTCDKEIFTGGHADNSIKLISSDGAKTIETAAGHCAPVTCLTLSKDSNYLVTGSRDTTVIVWRIHCVSPSNVKNASESTSAPVSPTSGSDLHSATDTNRRRRIEGAMHVLRGHLGEIISCSVCSDLGVVASCSNASGVILHSLRRGHLIKKLDIQAHIICLSSLGVLLIWNKFKKRLSTFTVNGIPIATTLVSPFSGSISCIHISADGENALIGTASSTDQINKDIIPENSSMEPDRSDEIATSRESITIPVPSIAFLNLHTLKVFHSLVMERNQDITCIGLDKDSTNLLVSTADKQLIIFTDPALSLKVVDHMLRLGWEGDGLLKS